MKILFLYLKSFSEIGGIEKFNRAFMKGLNDVSSDNPKISFSANSLYDIEPDLKYIDKEYFFGFGGNKITFIFYSVLQILKSDKIIIGHINLSLIGIIAKLLGKEVILVAHGIEVWNTDSYLKRYMLKNADIVLSVSRFTKSKIIDNVNINPDRVIVFPNTLDPYYVAGDKDKSITIREKYGISPACKIILTVSRLSFSEKYKGYEKVISILPELKKHIPEFTYLIAGGGDEAEFSRIKELVKELELNDKVRMLGKILDYELANLYSSADVFIMPSTGEGFGIVFLEALANGLPVIAGNKDGSTDPLVDGKMGILVDPENPDQIMKALSDVLDKNIKKDLPDKEYLKSEVENKFGFKKFRENINTVLKLNI